MARTKKSGTRTGGPRKLPPEDKLPWRITCIKLWREQADMTQQEVADRLLQMDPSLGRDRVSVGRIEAGLQRPPVVILEAMVVMFHAPNLSAMLDQTPEEAERRRKIDKIDPKEVERILRVIEAAKDEGT